MSESFFCENYIDIYTISQHKLAVYPSYLVLGHPIFDSSCEKVKFNRQSSLKITENYFSSWLHFFYKVLFIFIEDQHQDQHKEGQQLIYSEEPVEEQNKDNLQNQKNCYFYEITKTQDTYNKVKISSTFSIKPVHFEFNSWDFFQLCQAFTSIFFKVYCYTPTQNLCIDNFIKSENSGFVLQSSFSEVLLHLKNQTVYPLSLNECIRTAELIIRHKDILIQWKKLAVIL